MKPTLATNDNFSLKSSFQKKENSNLKCPLCKVNTPLIQDICMNSKTSSPFLILKCRCLSENKNYFISIDKYLDFLQRTPKCFKHPDKNAKFYCEECTFNMCDLCNSFHEIFEQNHHKKTISEIKEDKMTIEEENTFDTIDDVLTDAWKKTNACLEINSVEGIEEVYQKIIFEYNNYIISEIDIIDRIIDNLTNAKQEIEKKRKIVLENAKKITDIVKIIYNDFYSTSGGMNKKLKYENLLNMQRIKFNESLLVTYDGKFMHKINEVFSKYINVILKQQNDMTRRLIVTVSNSKEGNPSSNRQTSTRADLNEAGGSNSYVQNTDLILCEDVHKNEEEKVEDLNLNNCISPALQEGKENIPEKKVCQPQKCEQKITNKGFFQDGIQVSPILETSEFFNLSGNESEINIFSNPNNEMNSTVKFLYSEPTKKENTVIQNSQPFQGYDENTSNCKEILINDLELIPEKCIFTLPNHRGPISSIIQLKNNPSNIINGEIVTAGSDNNVIFWNPKNMQPVSKIVSKQANVLVLKELKDGSLAIATDDNLIKIYSIPSQICGNILVGHSNKITSLIQRGEYLLSSSLDCTIKIWSLKTKSCSKTLFKHAKCVNCIAEISNNSFASGSDDKKIIVWKKFKQDKVLEGHKAGILNIIYSEKDNIILSCGRENYVKIWALTDGICLGNLINNNSSIIYDMAFIGYNYQMVAVCDAEGNISYFDIPRRCCLDFMSKVCEYPITKLLYIQSENKFATGEQNGMIKIWT